MSARNHRRRPSALAACLLAAVTLVSCGSGSGAPQAATTTDVAREVVVADPTAGDVPPLHPSVDDYPEATVGLESPDRQRSVAVAVKVAHTDERRRHGLMEVEDVPGGVGMVFLFPSERTGSFWMKNTKVPLSIAWATADGAIIDIQHMDPCEADPCERYSPGAAYQYALEVPQGWFAEQGIDEDWTLRLPDGMPSAD